VAELLRTRGLCAFYGDFQALFGIDFFIEEGQTVAIIGANGAGKSTFLKCLTGLLACPAQAITWDGRAVGGTAAHRLVADGIAMVPEGRRLFASLSVEENLVTGAYTRRRGPWTLERVYALFPVLRERRRASATALSGGQQQMVAIGRALMANPRLLICDELSLGLAPLVIREIYTALATVAKEGMTSILVEQDVAAARAHSQRLYCFQEGRVALACASHETTMDEISLAYFGV
jgi:branched-chain amino acid transport system ATP-binding protein